MITFGLLALCVGMTFLILVVQLDRKEFDRLNSHVGHLENIQDQLIKDVRKLKAGDPIQ